TKIRDLQAKIRLADNTLAFDRSKTKTAAEHVEFAHDRINELLAETKKLNTSLQNQEAVQGSSSDEKELLTDKLSAANKQLETLRQRNQELEVELSVLHEPDMLASHDDDGDDSEAEDDDVDPFKPTVTDGSPSLIHALTGELDRWKRHCHVLGDELKTQRHRVTEADEVAAHAATKPPEIDELTDIRGIGAVLVRKLHQLGIYRYEDLLNLNAEGLAQAQQLIPDFERRMERDNWLEQARMLCESKYQAGSEQTEYASLS
ncbi:MAG: hypothetical protein QGG54_11080, partial [Gammaproteobacteria bacterium]|nr:hypothetical protein [Gammaproteobacteria bacterium]